jgi:putative ABC transport system permease protein
MTMSMLSQTLALTALNLQELRHRIRSSSVMVIGVAAAVAALVSLLALGVGLRAMALQGVGPGEVLVLPGGAFNEGSGNLSPAAVAQIEQAPGVAAGKDGSPMVQPMAVVFVDVMRSRDGVIDSIPLRGSGPKGLAMTQDFRLISGRLYQPGADELIVGQKAAAEYEGLQPGATISLRGTPWKVVGVYSAGGGLAEAEMLAEAPTVMSAFQHPGYQSVELELTSPTAFRRFDDAVSSNPQLQVTARLYREFLAAETVQLTRVLNFVAYFVGVVMAGGAIFGAVNTLYSAVEARTREIATLRALGFGAAPVIVSILAESLVLAIPGALIGAACAWLLINGQQAAVAGLTFTLAVTPGLVWVGLILALVVGAVGAFAPAIRAAKLPIAEALRAT